MSLLGGPRAREPERRTDYPTSSLSELVRRRDPIDYAGVHVDSDTAARHGTVFACVDLIGRMLSTLPIHEYRRDRDGLLVPLKDPAVLESPDGDLDWPAWCYALVDSLLKTGNAYAYVESTGLDGWPTQVALVHPSDVTWSRQGKRGPVDWRLDGKPIRKWPDGELWHMPAYTVAGSPVGISPLRYAALTVGMGLAAQRFASRWFRDNAAPVAVLKHPSEINRTVAELVKQRWLDALHGNREPVVLGSGWEYEPVSVNAEESQFLDTIQANASDVCRYFGVLPEEVGAATSGANITYANIEQRQIHLLVRTLGPWMVRVENALTRLRPRPRILRFNPEGLLRVDTITRHQAYETAIRNGWMSVNEVRILEDRPGIGPDGDRYVWPPYRSQLTTEELGGEPVDEGGEEVDAGEDDDGLRAFATLGKPAYAGGNGNGVT